MFSRAIIYSMLLSAIAVSAEAQKTLREQARETHAPVRRTTTVLVPAMDLPELVAKADLIMHARITRGAPHLTPDEQWVVTTFSLSPLQVLLDKAMAGKPTPTLPRDYSVSLLGGEVTIEGVPVSSAAMGSPLPDVGDEVILFLTRSEELHSWVPIAGPYAVYKVKADGSVQSSNETVRHNGKARADFLREIGNEIARTPK